MCAHFAGRSAMSVNRNSRDGCRRSARHQRHADPGALMLSVEQATLAWNALLKEAAKLEEPDPHREVVVRDEEPRSPRSIACGTWTGHRFHPTTGLTILCRTRLTAQRPNGLHGPFVQAQTDDQERSAALTERLNQRIREALTVSV